MAEKVLSTLLRLCIVLEKLFLIELEVVERLLECTTYRPGRVGLERNVGLSTARGYLLKIIHGRIRLVRAHFADLEMLPCVLDERNEPSPPCRE